MLRSFERKRGSRLQNFEGRGRRTAWFQKIRHVMKKKVKEKRHIPGPNPDRAYSSAGVDQNSAEVEICKAYATIGGRAEVSRLMLSIQGTDRNIKLSNPDPNPSLTSLWRPFGGSCRRGPPILILIMNLYLAY